MIRKQTRLLVSAIAFAAALTACGDSESEAPEPFTVKADLSMVFQDVGVLGMVPSDCDSVTTDSGSWRTEIPVIFKQGDSEIGTGDVASELGDISAGGRICSYFIVGRITPKNDSDVTAELSDGYEWTRSIADWKESTPFLYQSGLTP